MRLRTIIVALALGSSGCATYTADVAGIWRPVSARILDGSDECFSKWHLEGEDLQDELPYWQLVRSGLDLDLYLYFDTLSPELVTTCKRRGRRATCGPRFGTYEREDTVIATQFDYALTLTGVDEGVFTTTTFKECTGSLCDEFELCSGTGELVVERYEPE